ncbi:phosphatase PAP2 family protein [Hymenobacter radiodurans]|uniref:phosphatase PAP2 family protein n=1 Tax=Hymenobacter radiodurans TaxID=2496028 RepID=UPI0010586014|nr:phosphatase PAP2 family protein [Hymenobacter radiodurans]
MKTLTTKLLKLLGLLTVEIVLVSVLFLAAFVVFFYLTRIVFEQQSGALDEAAFQWMDAHRAQWPALTPWIRGITFFASAPFLVATAILLPAGLALRNHRREGLEVFWAIAGAALLNQLLKTHFHRLRPDTALLQQYGLSFPSGHAMIGLALYGCLAWLLWRHRRHPAWAALLFLWAFLIGMSRVYLHVHYFTDVLAGFAAGLAWLILLRAGLHLWWREKAILEEEVTD